ncbi:hypothetical protein Cni_G03114 [Canna indica]|uniref:Pectate lyase superfamily protein domain-containing protein n=1 Tax=Canna indica TaxID=4628 RepID=A0AAQ3JSQ4_9LILI|nr:hypothetical protein Cni_G03114 [Canna indica]
MAELNTTSSSILLLALLVFSLVDAAFDIADYNAKSDGRTDSTKSLLNVWEAACGSTAPVTVHVPAGYFLVRQVSGTYMSSLFI